MLLVESIASTIDRALFIVMNNKRINIVFAIGIWVIKPILVYDGDIYSALSLNIRYYNILCIYSIHHKSIGGQLLEVGSTQKQVKLVYSWADSHDLRSSIKTPGISNIMNWLWICGVEYNSIAQESILKT